ncbi:DUF192 domain-containing protein [Alkalicaulis satelles]|uniref:DUF192 domain-containing protein n=1 Tax=Alkalicaulis satelles TaxID=2609175 RepID=A0A5M6ZL67_9PROT|nr:DUF192 domain-containing protein [Alkalicaulis satelles]KAA5805070.1 DUF192 domain-containing protein [Alkalicaulis satelles]
MTTILSWPRLAGAFSALVLFAAACAHAVSDPTAPDAVVAFGGPDRVVIETADGPVEFLAEIAATDEQRQRGLMHRESLDPDAGMLFDFEREQIVSIWMENTLIPLDILYIRRDGRIVKIIENAEPLSRSQLLSDFPVLAVLEIAGGRAGERGIEPGDTVRHALFGNAMTDAPAPADDDGGADEDGENGAEGEGAEDDSEDDNADDAEG